MGHEGALSGAEAMSEREAGRGGAATEIRPHGPPAGQDSEEVEGLDERAGSWGDYPVDDLRIRSDFRTTYEVAKGIDQGGYVLNPEFQRDFVWPEDKQSKLIESVVMRLPLPAFYLAEDDQGRMVVVDGLQRLSTLVRFIADELPLHLPDRRQLEGRRFSDLPTKLKNRVEDCQLILHIIDSKVPDRARLDIFERVNSGMPLSRQQMRNCLFMGKATEFLREETKTDIFQKATGRSLRSGNMRDREFVNRFCAFRILGPDEYRGDMDEFLAASLRRMNGMKPDGLDRLSHGLRRGLSNSLLIFGEHSFRKSMKGARRSPLNASLWDVMSTGLSRYEPDHVDKNASRVRRSLRLLVEDEDFNASISHGPNDIKKVRHRFEATRAMFERVLGDFTN